MIAAGLVALLVLALPALAPVDPFGGAPRAALVLLPLLFAAGLPRDPNAAPAAWTARAAAALAAAPCVALAARTDAARAQLDAVGLACGAGMLVLLLVAADRGRGRRARPYAVAWLAGVLLAPLLALALAWGARGAQGPEWAEALRALSPLAWAWDRAAGVPRAAWAPLATSAALLALTAGPPGPSGAASAGSAGRDAAEDPGAEARP